MRNKNQNGKLTRRQCIQTGISLALAAIESDSIGQTSKGVELSDKPVITRTDNAIIILSKTYEIKLSADNGAILSIGKPKTDQNLVNNGEWGLWRAKFQDGETIQANDFQRNKNEALFTSQEDKNGDSVHFVYKSGEIEVRASIHARADELIFDAQIQPFAKNLLDFSLPARLRFDPNNIKRIIFPINGNMGVGAAFESAFFQTQSSEHPAGWQQRNPNGQGYTLIYGNSPVMRPNLDPPVALAVTEEGKRWFDTTTINVLNSSNAVVNRAPMSNSSLISLVDSPNGSWFSMDHLGGRGAIWRIGGGVDDTEKNIVLDAIGGVINRLFNAGSKRTKLGVISLEAGPEFGGWAAVSVKEWMQTLLNLPATLSNGIQIIQLSSPGEIATALAGTDYLAILNPYGEGCPTLPGEDMQTTIALIKKYLLAGGNWFETGGYSFFYSLEPILHYDYNDTYPDLFADFIHMDFEDTSLSVFRVQPENTTPWIGAKSVDKIFTPGRLGCGSDDRGGYIDRSYGTYIASTGKGVVPPTCLHFGDTAESGIDQYCQRNNIRTVLKDKVHPDVLGKLKRSVLLYYAGAAKEKIKYLPLLPLPTLIHFADYIHGGFDKQYPDLLPPNPQFGTSEELKAFYDRAHALGHLVMPYTNTTWWCDHPRGPTFQKDGDAPLVKQFNGKPIYEKYALNDGWTNCLWHPDVRAANLRIRRQFTVDYPSDVLFQDQVGARGWVYDMNPASPTPYAYSEGMLSQSMQDSHFVPLSTEAGWDRVAEFETQLCGLSWELVPTEDAPSWRRLMKTSYATNTWRVYPLAQRIAHTRAMMLFHDLGQFVRNDQTLAWALGLGFSLSFTAAASSLQEPARLEWLRWLDRLQKSVCARYIGESVGEFEHNWGDSAKVEDDGVIRVQYGSTKILANLGPQVRKMDGYALSAYGFMAIGEGMMAASIQRAEDLQFAEQRQSFAYEKDSKSFHIWMYGPEGDQMIIPMKHEATGKRLLIFDAGDKVNATVKDGGMVFELPIKNADNKQILPPMSLSSLPPIKWGTKAPSIGVLDMPWMGGLAWTRLNPQDWMNALKDNSELSKLGVVITPITTIDQLYQALEAGVSKYLTIINPYGEKFPVYHRAEWRKSLDIIRNYVRNGGSWWETGGQSFTQAIAQDGKVEPLGSDGLAYIGLSVDNDDKATDTISITSLGERWLGKELADKIQGRICNANRGLPKGFATEHQTLVSCGVKDYIGGYRLRGWGWLWRIGGFYPDPEISLDVVEGVTEHQYLTPSAPILTEGVRYLWHATVH